jgi:hypothetical protein
MRSLPAEELLVARTPRLQFFGSTYRETMLLINDGTNFKSSARVFFTASRFGLNSGYSQIANIYFLFRESTI